MKKRTRGALIVLGTVFVALVGAEVWLRGYRPVQHRLPLDRSGVPPGVTLYHQVSSVPGLPFELIPGARGIYAGAEVSINALGQRGPEVERVKAPGTYRVVAIGDSLTFGYSAPQDATWPAALERILRAAPGSVGARSVEVLNLGVSAYNSADEARVLETKALELEPDVIVVGYFLNDPQVAPLQALQRWFREPALWERSHLLRLIDAWRFARAKERHGNDGYRNLHDPDGEGWAMVVDAFASMHRAASARDVPVLVVTLPAFPPGPDWNGYPWSDLHEQVIAAARASGLAAFDTVSAFQADGRRPKDLCVDFEHPNAAGAEIIARAVAQEIHDLLWWPADGKPR